MTRRHDLRGAVIVVTGASSGIGRATALQLADAGSKLVLSSRSDPALEEVADTCRARGAEVLVAPADIADPDAVEDVRRGAVERWGRIDVWIQAAAVTIAGPLGSEPFAEARRLLDINVLGNVVVARAALATFRSQGHGTLVLVGSLLGLFPNPQVPLYSMSKFATRGLALNCRAAVADLPDVHVSLVLPGPVDTPLFGRSANHSGRTLRAIPPAEAPERVAASILACARRPRRQVTSGVLSHLALVCSRVSPAATEWAVARWSAATITTSEPAPDSAGTLFEPTPHGAVHGPHRRGRLRRRLGQRLGTWQARHQTAPNPEPETTEGVGCGAARAAR